LALEVFLEPNNLFKKFLGLALDVLLDEVELHLVFGRQLGRIDILNEYLALLKASTYLVWQPSCNRSSTCCSWVLDIVNDIFFHHSPMLVSEFESSMNVLEHQESRVGVLKSESFLTCLELLFTETIDILLMIVWSVSSHLEKILSQRVSWVSQPKCVINRRDDAVLSSSLTPISLWSITHTFV
jgi:hypothetical protein